MLSQVPKVIYFGTGWAYPGKIASEGRPLCTSSPMALKTYEPSKRNFRWATDTMAGSDPIPP